MKQVKSFLEHCIEESREIGSFNAQQLVLASSLQALVQTIQALRDSLRMLKQFDGQFRNPLSLQMRRRVKWVFERQYFVDEMAMVASRKDMIVAHLSLLK